MRFLEVGCGSGCISLALLKAMPGCTATAIDVSDSAVELTRENALRSGAFPLCVGYARSLVVLRSVPYRENEIVRRSEDLIATAVC